MKCLQPFGYAGFNLGNDTLVEPIQVIHLIEENLGKEAKIEWLERHSTDVLAAWADIKKAKTVQKWVPTMNIGDGISNTVQWCRGNREFLLTMRL